MAHLGSRFDDHTLDPARPQLDCYGQTDRPAADQDDLGALRSQHLRRFRR